MSETKIRFIRFVDKILIPMIRHKYIVTILFFIFNSIIYSQEYRFTNYSTAEGLSHKTVFCLFEDSEGFIWIGTTNGLNRYDGYQFKQFFNDENDSSSICGNFILEITEDKDGLIWIATAQGCCYYNPVTEKFTKVTESSADEPVSPMRMCHSESGVVWGISKNNFLTRIDIRDSVKTRQFKLDSLYEFKGGFEAWNIEYNNDSLWVCTSVGVLKINENTLEVQRLDHSDYEFNSVKEISVEKDNQLIFTDRSNSVYIYDGNSGHIKLYDSKNFYEVSQHLQYLTDADNDKQGNIWVTASPGLFRINEKGDVNSVNINSGSNYNFDNIRTNWIIRDKNGNMWIATMDFGVFVINNSNNSFYKKILSRKDNAGIPVSGFIIIGDNTFYGNTYGAFLTNKTISKAKKIIDIPIKGIHQLNENELVLVGMHSFYIYNLKSDNLKKISGLKGFIFRSYLDSKGILWVLPWGRGINGYNLKTGEEYHINVDTLDNSNNVVFSICEADSSLWLGMFGNGLFQVKNPLSPNPEVIRCIPEMMQKTDGSNVILAISTDKDSNLWLGTNGGGLLQFNINTNEFKQYKTIDGLKSNVVESVILDEQGDVWFTTSIVSKYDISKNKFTHYDISNGVSSKYFHFFSYQDNEGKIYLGDDSGLLTFDPLKINEKDVPNIPILTAFEVFGNVMKADVPFEDIVPLKKSINTTNTISLPSNYNSIKLEFASLHILENKNITYAYMLEGAEKRWNYTQLNEYSAKYSGLRPGEYTFKVRASNDRENWSESKLVNIIITPPWWQTLLFKIILTICIVSIIVTYILLRFKRINKINKLLERKIAERTENLIHTNELLQEEQVIIEMKNNQLNKALDSKQKLINILAHDFKNPLSGILGISQLLEKESKKYNLEKIMKFSTSIANSAYSLTNQMISVLDWAQSENTDFKAEPIEININFLIDDALSLIKSSASEKEIKIRTQNDCNTNTFVDPRMGNVVFRNILSNAIKYSSRGDTITIISKETENTISVSITDNGIGIKKENIDLLFDDKTTILNSSPGTEKEKGTGLGLKMCKTFINKNNGSISIDSIEGQGTTITVSLPKGKKHALKKIPKANKELGEIYEKTQDTTKTHSVLIVDDDIEILEVLKNNLESNFNVIQADNGFDGILLAHQVSPDVIISDINMFGMSGIEMCANLKNDQQTIHIPILLISSYNETELKEQAFRNGANDYIEKPFNPLILKKKVESLLVLHQKIREKTRDKLALEVCPHIPNDFNNNFVKKVYDYVEKNMKNEKLNISNVAQELNISRSQLWRIFKTETGITLSEYIKQKHKQKLALALLTGKYRISEVAYEFGFSDPGYFTRWFKKEFGMSPTEFIKLKNSKF